MNSLKLIRFKNSYCNGLINNARYMNTKIWPLKKSKEKSKGPYWKRENPLEVESSTFDVFDLQNGIRAIHEGRNSEFTIVGCFVPGGSMSENCDERGSSLILEHMLFRKTEQNDLIKFEEKMGIIGGKLGALAMRDGFVYYGIAPNNQADKIVEILSDVTFNRVLCEKDLSQVKCSIFRHLNEMEKNHEQVLMDYLPTLAYQETPLSNSIYPKTNQLWNLTLKQICCFADRLITPCNITLVSSGGIPACEFRNMVEEHFCLINLDCPVKEIAVRAFPRMDQMRFTGCDMRLRDDDDKFGYAVIAVQGPGYQNCDDHCALTVAKELVGSWNLGYFGGPNRLEKISQEAFKKPFAKSYKSFNIGYWSTSLWGCYFHCEPMDLEFMQCHLQNEWLRLASSSLSDKDVNAAVNKCKTQELLNLQHPEDNFFDIVTCLLRRGKYFSAPKRMQTFEKVNAAKVRQVMLKYVYDQCPVIVAKGRTENLPDYTLIRSHMWTTLS